MAACEVLVEYNNRRQVVKFCRSEEFSDVTILKNEGVQGERRICYSDEEWGGEFVDVMNEGIIAEH